MRLYLSRKPCLNDNREFCVVAAAPCGRICTRWFRFIAARVFEARSLSATAGVPHLAAHGRLDIVSTPTLKGLMSNDLNTTVMLIRIRQASWQRLRSFESADCLNRKVAVCVTSRLANRLKTFINALNEAFGRLCNL